MEFIPFLIILTIWLLPLIFIIRSQRVGGREKLAWVLAVIFISWFAWIFFMLLAPLKPRDR